MIPLSDLFHIFIRESVYHTPPLQKKNKKVEGDLVKQTNQIFHCQLSELTSGRLIHARGDMCHHFQVFN